MIFDRYTGTSDRTYGPHRIEIFCCKVHGYKIVTWEHESWLCSIVARGQSPLPIVEIGAKGKWVALNVT